MIRHMITTVVDEIILLINLIHGMTPYIRADPINTKTIAFPIVRVPGVPNLHAYLLKDIDPIFKILTTCGGYGWPQHAPGESGGRERNSLISFANLPTTQACQNDKNRPTPC